MKKFLAAMVLVFGLPICQLAKEDKATIILPNLRLLACRSADCSQLWSEESTNTNAVSAKQLIIDFDHGCVYGMRAFYEKSVSFDDLGAAIDGKYGKWTVPQFEKGPMRLWRVEPEKFSIQMVVLDKKDEKRRYAEAGTKQITFIAFGGRSACATR